MTDDEKRELIAVKLRYAVRGEVDGTTIPVPVEDCRLIADALEGTLTEPEWEYRARVEWIDPYDERRHPNSYIGKGRAFTAEEMANPVVVDDESGQNVYEGCYLKEQEMRRKAGPWEVVADDRERADNGD